MMRKHIVLIALFMIMAVLLTACGEKTTVEPTPEVKNAAPVATPDFLLQIVSFAYDSSQPNSPVTVKWLADGSFPEGFMLVWSPDNPFAEPGSSGWAKVSDGNAREAMVAIDQDQSYYFRVCKVVADVCRGYSDPVQVVFISEPDNGSNGTQEATRTSKPENPTKTPTVMKTAFPKAVLTIMEVKGESTGKVTVSWSLEGTAPEGFKLIWSGSNENPTYPENESQRVNDSAARSAVQEGFTPGIQYYFRVCQFVDNACQAYSNVVAYRVPPAVTATPTVKATGESSGLVLTGVKETAKGQVNLTWTAVGSYPQGFKVVWSKNSSIPTFPSDDNVYLSDPAVRSKVITGLTEGVKYYFRVCKYNGSNCESYSNTLSVSLSSSAVTEEKLVLTSVTKISDSKVKLEWTANGSFSNGFKIAYSSHNTNPVYPGDEYVYASDPAARSISVDGLKAGETYYFRVCKYNGSGCDFYSNMKEYSVPAGAPTPDSSSISLISINDGGCGAATVKWNAEGSFAKGFKVVWSDSNTAPAFPADSWDYYSDPATRQATIDDLIGGSTYYFRVCRYTGSACDVYSDMQQYTVPCDD